jgi:hypothetical protein
VGTLSGAEPGIFRAFGERGRASKRIMWREDVWKRILKIRDC